MWKTILAGTAAVAIAGTSIVYAQQQQAQQPQKAQERRQPSQEDMSAFTDARLAALKVGLRLTAEQEKLWPNFETALRDIAKARMDRRLERRNERANQQPQAVDPVERMRRLGEAMSTDGAALKRLADAQEPLYKSFDDSQKHRFQVLSRLLGPRPMRFAEMGGRGDREWRGRHHRDHYGQQGPRGG